MLALIIALLSRVPFFPNFPTSFDALNYMRALEHMDMRLHQPQPPGYPLYILIGRIFLWVSGDPHRALLYLSAVGSVLAAWALYTLGSRLYGKRTGALAAIFLFTAQAVWYQSELAAPYTLDLLFSIGIALLAWETQHSQRQTSPWLLCILLGLSGAFRPQTMVFLTPLAAFALSKRGWRTLLSGGLLAGAVFAIGFAPIVFASGGWDGYLAALGHITEIPAWGLAHVDGQARLLRNTAIVLRLTLQAMSEPLWLLAAFGVVAGFWQRSAEDGHNGKWKFYLLWLLPAWAIYILLWPGNRGTILVSMAPFYLLAALGTNYLIRRQVAAGWSVAAFIVVWHIALFAFLPQQVFGEHWQRYNNAATIRWKADYYRNRLDAVSRLPAEGTLVYAVEFRHLQTYLPQYHVFSPPIFDPQGSGAVVSIIEIRQGEQIVQRNPALEALIPPDTRRIVLFDLPPEVIHAPPAWITSLPVPDAAPLTLLTLPADASAHWTAAGIQASPPTAESLAPAAEASPPEPFPTAPSTAGPADISILLNAPHEAPPPLAYGVNGWWSDEDADLLSARYAELAPKVVRLPLMAAIIEPVNDNDNPNNADKRHFGFEQPFDTGNRHLTYARWFAALRDLDVDIMLYIPYLPAWMAKHPGPTPLTAPYPPADMDEYAELVRVTLHYLVEDIGYPPERIIFEPVNEPDLQCGSDPAVACFWRNGNFESLTAVIQTAQREAKAVSPHIRIAGLTTCCTHAMLDRFMEDPTRAALLDIITYHDYSSGFSIGRALDTGTHLQTYDKPVYLDEYGSTTYWSDGTEGALWHAAVLPQLWAHGIVPIQFSLSEWPGMHAGYNQLGLMHDWQADWQVKPAYFVYQNFYAAIPGLQPVTVRAPQGIFSWGGIDPARGHIVLWLVNGAWQENGGELTLEISDFSGESVLIQVQDTLRSPAQDQTTFQVVASPEGSIRFKVHLPPRTAQIVFLTPED